MAHSRGFTLIELLICAAIITVLSSIVIVRFTSFDGTVLLKSLAYEVATGVREAQIYSVSVVNTDGVSGFRNPYGVSFTPGASGYIFFRYNNANSAPYYSASVASVVRTISFLDSMKILDVCAVRGTGPDCDISQLDISFRRPEFTALFAAQGGTTGAISEGLVKLCSIRSPANIWIVSVTLLGQISVYKDTTATTCT